MAPTDSLSALLSSKKQSTQLLGLAAAALFFVPALTDIADNPSLSLWGRIGKVSTAAGQLLTTIGVAGIDPKILSDAQNEE